jgi:hypothetical protein
MYRVGTSELSSRGPCSAVDRVSEARLRRAELVAGGVEPSQGSTVKC